MKFRQAVNEYRWFTLWFIILAIVLIGVPVISGLYRPAEEDVTSEFLTATPIDTTLTFGPLRIDVSPDGTIACVRSRQPDAMACWIREQYEDEDVSDLRNARQS